MRARTNDVMDLSETFDHRLFLRIDNKNSGSQPDHCQHHQDQQAQIFLGHAEFEFALQVVQQFINIRGRIVFVPWRFIGRLVPFHNEDLVSLKIFLKNHSESVVF